MSGNGQRLSEAGPSSAVKILGLPDVDASAGELLTEAISSQHASRVTAMRERARQVRAQLPQQII